MSKTRYLEDDGFATTEISLDRLVMPYILLGIAIGIVVGFIGTFILFS